MRTETRQEVAKRLKEMAKVMPAAGAKLERQASMGAWAVAEVVKAQQAQLVVVSETRLGAGEDTEAMEHQCTCGENAAWEVHSTPRPEGGTGNEGVLVWFDTSAFVRQRHGGRECTAEEIVPGRLLRLRMQVLADGSLFTLLAAYAPPREMYEGQRAHDARLAMWEALEKAVAEEEAAGRCVMVAGDLNAETPVALEHWGREALPSDDALADLLAVHDLESVGAVEATYVRHTGAAMRASSIDHWLMTGAWRRA